jgi:hypothetical protein
MGTRNLTCVVVDGKMKVAQYCQWDGYLSGQGKDLMEFIAKTMVFSKFKKAIQKCTLLNQAQIEARYKEVGIDGEYMDENEAKQLTEKFPSFSRDTGAKLLYLIQEKGVRDLIDSSSFAADSLFCEYAYVLDLDNKNLEIYRGFQKSEPKKNERFYYLTKHTKKDDYKPIHLVHIFSFKDIKKKSFEELEQEFKDKLQQLEPVKT